MGEWCVTRTGLGHVKLKTRGLFFPCVHHHSEKLWAYVIISVQSTLVIALYNFLGYSCSQSNITLQPPFSSYQQKFKAEYALIR